MANNNQIDNMFSNAFANSDGKDFVAPKENTNGNTADAMFDSAFAATPDIALPETATDEPTIKNLIKYGAETSLTGDIIKGIGSLFKEGKSTPVVEPNYAKWDDNKLKWLMQHGIATASNIVSDIPAILALETGVGELGIGAGVAAKVAEASPAVSKALPVIAKGVELTPEWIAEIGLKQAPKVAENVVANTVKKDALQNILKQGIVGGAYEGIRSPLEQVQNKGEYSPIEHAQDIGAGAASFAGLATGGEILKNILGKPNLFNEVGRIENKAIKERASETSKDTLKAFKETLLDPEKVNIDADVRENAVAHLDELDKVIKQGMINVEKEITEKVNSGESIANVMNIVDRNLASANKVLNKYLLKFGIDDPQGFFLNLQRAKYASQAETIKLEKELLPHLKTLYKSISPEELTTLMGNSETNLEILPEITRIKAKFKNPIEAKTHLTALRDINDRLYDEEATTVFKNLVNDTNKLIDMHTDIPQSITDKLKNNITLANSEIENALQSGNNQPLRDVVASKALWKEKLLNNLSPEEVTQLNNRMRLSKLSKIQMEMPYEPNYAPKIPKLEFMGKAFKSNPMGVEVNDKVGAVKMASRAPRHTFARGTWGLAEEELEKDYNVLMSKYIRSHSAFKHMGDTNKQLLNILEHVESKPILRDEALTAWKRNMNEAINNTLRYEQTSDKKLVTLEDWMKAVKGEFSKAKGIEPVTPTEMAAIEEFFSKNKNFLKDIKQTYIKSAPVNFDRIETASGNIIGRINSIPQIAKTESELYEGEKKIIVQTIESMYGVNNTEAQSILQSSDEKTKSALKKLLIGETQVVKKGSTKEIINKAVNDLTTLVEETKDITGTFEKEGKNTLHTARKGVVEALNKLSKTTNTVERYSILKDEKLQNKILSLTKYAEQANDRYGGRRFLSIMDDEATSKLVGPLGDAIENFTHTQQPIAKTDFSNYMAKWASNYIGVTTDPATIAGKTRLSGFINKIAGRNPEAQKGLVGGIRKWFGNQIDPNTTVDELLDTGISQVYSNLMGWKVTPILRNMTQHPFLAMPNINIPLHWQPEIQLKSMIKLFNPAYRNALKDEMLHAPMLRSEESILPRNPFKVGSTLDKIYKGKLALDRIGMWAWEASDRFQRYQTYAYAESAAEKVLSNNNAKGLIDKLLSPVYLDMAERKHLYKLLANGNREAFTKEYARMMTNNNQFIYDSMAGSGLQRGSKLSHMMMMFTKWPTEIVAREARYLHGLGSKSTAFDAGKAIAKDIAYASLVIAFAKSIGMDITDWHPLTSVSGKYESPLLKLATEPSWKSASQMFTPFPSMYKGATRTLGIDKKRQPITGIPYYKKGVPNKALEGSLLYKLVGKKVTGG